MVFPNIRRTFAAACAVSLLFLQSAFPASPGTSIFPFLKITPSAHMTAMGEIDTDINFSASFSNPALLPWIDRRQVSFQQLLYVADINYSQVAFLSPLDQDSAFNASFGYLGSGSLTRTVADSSISGYAETGSFGATDMQLSAGYGQRISSEFSWGAGAKVARESIDGHDTIGVMASVGGYYYPLGGLYRPMEEDWQIGFGVMNIGPKTAGFDPPMGAFLGIGKHLLNQRLFFGGEVVQYLDQMGDVRAGLEYDVTETLFLRGGYKHILREQDLGSFPQVNVSGGFGIRINQFVVDYAWAPYGDLGTSHRLSVSALLGPDPESTVKKKKNRRQ